MATCPDCLEHYDDELGTCPRDGANLLKDQVFFGVETDLGAGETVGEYRVEGKLGQGGFGTVYSGVHPLIGKRVAIKVLNRAYSSNPEMVSRFMAEARAVNQIRHRNIVDIFSFGGLEDGRQYYVMEILEGIPFDEFLDQRGHLPLGDAVRILRQIARALDAAHAQGIAHRDLKPENVFLTFDEEGQPFPKLLDFGIAKLLDEKEGGARTKTGVPMGTPHYMSPEQCRGIDVDHRTDIYSFGVMLFEALTGEKPFDGEAMTDVMLKQVSTAPPRLSEQGVGFEKAMDAPLLMMLEKDASRRPSSVTEALDQFVEAASEAGYEVSTAPSVSNVAVSRTVSTPLFVAARDRTMTMNSDALMITERAGKLRRWLAPAAFVVFGVCVVVVVIRLAMRPPREVVVERAGRLNSQVREGPAATLPAAVKEPERSKQDGKKTIAVTINTPTDGARVHLGDRFLGIAPGPFDLETSSETVELRVTSVGYLPKTITVTLEKDKSLDVNLVRIPARKPRSHAKPATRSSKDLEF